jgi:hypothetical protein
MTFSFWRCRAARCEAETTIRLFLRTLARLVPRHG